MRELDFGDYNEKLAKSGREVLALAIEESRRRDQNYLAAEHLFLGSVRIEQKLFNETLRDLRVEPDKIIKEVKKNLDFTKQYEGKGLKITFSMKSIFRLAWINCFQKGRSKIEAYDLLLAIFQEGNNIPVEIFRLHGIEPEKVVRSINKHLGNRPVSIEELKRKFDLPRYLKRLTLNFNRLARRNKIPITPSREDEVEELVNILSSNDQHSILLVDENGLGGMALAETFARRLELEINLLPESLRGCQLLEFHLDPLIPGERFLVPLENMISELKERQDLILFVPNIQNLLLPGTKPEIPAEAIQEFKSAIIDAAIRVIGTVPQSVIPQLVQIEDSDASAFRIVNVRTPSETEVANIVQREEKRKAVVLRRWGIVEISEETKQAVRNAVASGDFEGAFYLLSEHYNPVEEDGVSSYPNAPILWKRLLLPSAIILLFLLTVLVVALLTAR